ncbi:cytochrome P450 [Allohahella marinimesophila]|uniref:Fatty-acid peroxygenase n=1 Tax=Allohahella marinimesophila TaxID=1054972 RepID=A0ABP7PRS6_9GAMM
MSDIPKDSALDSTLAILSDGYEFIQKRRRRYESDIFRIRLMLKPTVCIGGEEAAEVFYKPERFTRKGALPKPILWSLQDEGSVAVLDAAEHHRRKQMFMSMMTPGSIGGLSELFTDAWREAIPGWSGDKPVSLLGSINRVICKAVCTWSGVNLSENELDKRTSELAAMIDGAGTAGPRNWRGLWLRRRTEKWARALIRQVRRGGVEVAPNRPLSIIAFHEDAQGDQLSEEVAAVELLNILRPTVAIGRYVMFAGHALHVHEPDRKRLLEDDDYLTSFVQEVRRYYPFFPFAGGLVREPFKWRSHEFRKGDLVLLDLYGTNRDEAIWKNADQFNAARFLEADITPFNLIPQGGGTFDINHRCAGEWLTIEMLKQAVRMLVGEMAYKVPEQDLAIDLSRMPAQPPEGFLISDVKRSARPVMRKKSENTPG